MLHKYFQGNYLERLLVCGGKDDWAGDSLVSSILPRLRANAPPVARFQPWETMLRRWGNQIVSTGSGEI